MNKKHVIALALLALPALTMAGPTDKIPKCTVSENFSEADIKYLGKGIFIDANGYQVEPCMQGEMVYFPIVAQIKDGVEIFQKAPGKTIHQEPNKKPPEKKPAVQEQQPQDPNGGYVLTYGDGNYEVEDVEEFREKSKARALGAPDELPDAKITIDEIIALIDIPPNLEIPLELQNSIASEKTARIQEDYQKVMSDITQAHQALIGTIYNDLVNQFVRNNRLYLSQQTSINQYGTQDYNASGIAYAIFDARLAASDFLNGYVVAVNKLATRDSIEDRLKIMEYIKEQEPMNLAGKYAQKKINNLMIELQSNPAAVERRGQKLLSQASPEDKAAFYEIVSAANEKIMENEYEEMPEEITKKQYKALSDVDKSKYAPVQSGQYINHNRYRKLPKDKVANRSMADKK